MFKSSRPALAILAALGAFGLIGQATVSEARSLSTTTRVIRKKAAKVSVSGDKLARKASRSQIAVCHGGLMPRITRPYPFSAKR